MTEGLTMAINSRLGAVTVLHEVVISCSVDVSTVVEYNVVVVVDTRLVVDTEVIVPVLALPMKYPTPAPASNATTKRAAMTSFLMPQRVASRGCKVLLMRTAQ